MVKDCPILLVTPTQLEAQAFSRFCTIHGVPIFICGVGPGACAMNMTRFLEQKGIHMVILAGIAGGYRWSGIRIGETVLATMESYGDLGRCLGNAVEEIRIPGEPIPLSFDLSDILTQIPTAFRLMDSRVKSGPMVTLSCTSTTMDRAKYMYRRFNALAENMEGAAIAQTCKHYGAPMVEIRGVSNWAGDGNFNNWMIDRALHNVANIVGDLLNALTWKWTKT